MRTRRVNKEFQVKAKKELEKIRRANKGRLHPESVVKSARSKRSPIHDYFEWEDSVAAHNFRVQQASELIRITVEVLPSSSVPSRVYVSLPSDRLSGGGYRSTKEVLLRSSTREEMLQSALVDLQALERKYGRLIELTDVFAASAHFRRKLREILKRSA